MIPAISEGILSFLGKVVSGGALRSNPFFTLTPHYSFHEGPNNKLHENMYALAVRKANISSTSKSVTKSIFSLYAPIQ
jgi:hypothetical protein